MNDDDQSMTMANIQMKVIRNSFQTHSNECDRKYVSLSKLSLSKQANEQTKKQSFKAHHL